MGVAEGWVSSYTLAMCKAESEHDELMALVEGLQGQVARHQKRIAELKAANEELHKELAEAKRAGKRQAAPFSKGRRSSKPKRPGRKPGTGQFIYRKPPSADEVTEPVVAVPVSGDTCPGCGGVLEHEGVAACLRDRPSTGSTSPGNGVSCAGMPVPVVRQAGARAASRHSAGPARGQRPPSGEAADGGGPRAPLWSGRSGTGRFLPFSER